MPSRRSPASLNRQKPRKNRHFAGRALADMPLRGRQLPDVRTSSP